MDLLNSSTVCSPGLADIHSSNDTTTKIRWQLGNSLNKQHGV